MKVAQILYSGLGGHGSVVFSLTGAACGRWSHCLGFLGIEPIVPDYHKRCHENRIPYRYFAARAGQPWRRWGALYRWLLSERPNAIINHSTTAIPVCASYSRLYKIPFVHVEHTPIATKSRQEWLGSGVAMALADHVVLLTPQYSELSAKRLGRWMRPEKVTVIPNGLDTGRWRSRPAIKLAGGTVRIGMAARFSRGKDFGLLIRTVAALRAQQPASGWRLTLAGDGPTRPEVAALAERIAPGQVTFKGLLDEGGLIAWMQSLDVYAHASVGETLSTSLLQAMACEIPIVASRVNGIRELLEPGQGLLAANDKLQEWTAALTSLVEDAELRRRLTRSGRALVERDYSAERMFERYATLVGSDLVNSC